MLSTLFLQGDQNHGEYWELISVFKCYYNKEHCEL